MLANLIKGLPFFVGTRVICNLLQPFFYDSPIYITSSFNRKDHQNIRFYLNTVNYQFNVPFFTPPILKTIAFKATEDMPFIVQNYPKVIVWFAASYRVLSKLFWLF